MELTKGSIVGMRKIVTDAFDNCLGLLSLLASYAVYTTAAQKNAIGHARFLDIVTTKYKRKDVDLWCSDVSHLVCDYVVDEEDEEDEDVPCFYPWTCATFLMGCFSVLLRNDVRGQASFYGCGFIHMKKHFLGEIGDMVAFNTIPLVIACRQNNSALVWRTYYDILRSACRYCFSKLSERFSVKTTKKLLSIIPAEKIMEYGFYGYMDPSAFAGYEHIFEEAIYQALKKGTLSNDRIPAWFDAIEVYGGYMDPERIIFLIDRLMAATENPEHRRVSSTRTTFFERECDALPRLVRATTHEGRQIIYQHACENIEKLHRGVYRDQIAQRVTILLSSLGDVRAACSLRTKNANG